MNELKLKWKKKPTRKEEEHKQAVNRSVVFKENREVGKTHKRTLRDQHVESKGTS